MYYIQILKTKMIHAVINSGGSGSRFWPLSRKKKPKQFLKVTDNTSLLEQSYMRLSQVTEAQNIHVCTTIDLLQETMKIIPKIPPHNFIIEPCAKNTAAAIALSAKYIMRQDPDAVIVFAHADHYIPQKDIFAESINTALEYAKDSESIVMLGIKPTYPSQGYGYIQKGEGMQQEGIYSVKSFREKPSKEVAEGYIASQQYFWNAGMFIARARVLLAEIEKYMPQLAMALQNIEKDSFAMQTVEMEYARLDSIPIDIGVIEKSDICTVLETDFTWEDLGSWSSLHKLYSEQGHKKDMDGNISITPQSYIAETSNCLIHTTKPTALVGVKDIAIIEQDDVLVVVNLKEDQKIKQIVNQVPDELK